MNPLPFPIPPFDHLSPCDQHQRGLRICLIGDTSSLKCCSEHRIAIMSVVNGDEVTLNDLMALNYTILIPYNASIPTGGDSLRDNLNLYYTVSGRRPSTKHAKT